MSVIIAERNNNGIPPETFVRQMADDLGKERR